MCGVLIMNVKSHIILRLDCIFNNIWAPFAKLFNFLYYPIKSSWLISQIQWRSYLYSSPDTVNIIGYFYNCYFSDGVHLIHRFWMTRSGKMHRMVCGLSDNGQHVFTMSVKSLCVLSMGWLCNLTTEFKNKASFREWLKAAMLREPTAICRQMNYYWTCWHQHVTSLRRWRAACCMLIDAITFGVIHWGEVVFVSWLALQRSDESLYSWM